MDIEKMEMQLNELEQKVKPDMFDSFEEYINHYRIAFYKEFGEEPCGKEPDFIQDARDFLKINHDVLKDEVHPEGNIIEFERKKNEKLLRDYYQKRKGNVHISIPVLTDDEIEYIVTSLSRDNKKLKKIKK